jgi:polyhydroxyalkanoate synthesis regulator phasin
VAKRDDKKKSAKQQSRTDAVRAAVDQAFQATADQAEGTQRRVQEIADELTSVAGRLREALDGARPVTATDLDALRADITGLTTRVAALEAAAAKPVPAARKPAARRPAAARSATAKPAARKPAAAKAAGARSTTAASKVPAARAAARRSAAKRPS